MEYNSTNPLRVFTAFSGYDSQCLALERLKEELHGFDYTLVGWSEIEPNAIKAHDALFPDAAELNFGDISKIEWGGQIPDFDLFTYSFPCQDISSAGLQRGLSEDSGSRSSLLWECKRAIEAKKPRYLLMENVKALTQEKFMPDFKKWMSWLESQGYKNFVQVLNAKDYGIPQNRERVFMMSIRDTNAQYYFPKPFKLERRLKDVLETNVDESYYLSDEKIRAIIEHCRRKQAEGCGFKTNFQTPEGTAGAIKTREGQREYDTYIKECQRKINWDLFDVVPITIEITQHSAELKYQCVTLGSFIKSLILKKPTGQIVVQGNGEYRGEVYFENGKIEEVVGLTDELLSNKFTITNFETYSNIIDVEIEITLPTTRTNERLGDMYADGRIDPSKTQYIDEYNMTTSEDVTGTILTRVDRSNHYFVNEGDSTPPPSKKSSMPPMME